MANGGSPGKAIRELQRSGATSRGRLRDVIIKYPELLAPEADASLTELVNDARRQGSDLAICWDYLHDVVRRCAREGPETIFKATASASSAWDLDRLLMKATSTRRTRWLIRNSRHLMREESVAELERMIQIAAEAGDPRALGWTYFPWVLRMCRAHGVETVLPMKLLEPAGFQIRHDRWKMGRFQRSMQQAMSSFHSTGNLGALDLAIQQCLTIPASAMFERADANAQAAILGNTAALLNIRGTFTDSLDDFQMAISLCDRAMALAEPGGLALHDAALKRAYSISALAERTQDAVVIDQAVAAATFAIQTAAARPWMAGPAQAALGVAFLARFALTGDVTDLHAAEDATREGLRMTAPWAENWPRFVMVLATLRFRTGLAFGDIGALEEVIRGARAVVPAFPEGSPDCLQARSLLGTALSARVLRIRNTSDLEEAIGHLEFAAAGPLGGPVAGIARMNLADALATRYMLESRRPDIDRAIELMQGMDETYADSLEYATRLTSLGSLLIDRYKAYAVPGDLTAGLTALRRAVALATADQQITAVLYYQRARGMQLDPGATASDVEEHYRKACVLGLQGGLRAGLEAAVYAAREWSTWAFDRASWQATAEACRYGLEAAVVLARRQHDRRHQESWLEAVKGMAARGAYSLVESQDPEAAILLLEHGRTVLLSDLLDLDRRQAERVIDVGRTDLYERFTRALDQLELESARVFGSHDQLLLPSAQAFGAQSSKTAQPEQARDAFDEVVKEIRRLPGQEGFLRPLSFDDVLAAASPAPLVYPVITKIGGLALVVGTGPRVKVCRLPDLTQQAIEDQFDDLPADELDLRQDAAGPGEMDDLTEFGEDMEKTSGWLWNTMMGPLLASTAGAKRLIIISDPLTRLVPLHAAWTPDPCRPSGRRYVVDHVALCYAPSAKTLLARASAPASPARAKGALIVREPAPVSARSLPQTAHEAAAVARAFTGSHLLEGRSATRAAVLGQLDSHLVIHFAGHAIAKTESPLDGGLLMAGDEMVTLRDLFRLRLTVPRLVVLSACETAFPGTEAPDEANSLPTGLLAAGVSGVVASLWPVFDDAAALLIRRFYSVWRDTGVNPPEALRQAQCWLRDATAAELATAFPDIPALAPPREELGAVVRAFWGGTRPYAEPLTWAAFTFTGVADLDI